MVFNLSEVPGEVLEQLMYKKGSAVLSWTKFPLREFVLRVDSQEPRGHPAALGAPTL